MFTFNGKNNNFKTQKWTEFVNICVKISNSFSFIIFVKNLSNLHQLLMLCTLSAKT